MATDRQIPVVALGASAGGVDALQRMVAGLPSDLPAAVLVVLHVAPAGPSVLPSILTRAGQLPAAHAVDGEEIERGHIYIAPPDRHLELEDGSLRVSRGPRENGVRPSVDTLFRSVARSRPRNSVAVVLSGTLDDGTAGMIEVRESGGRTVVQDPAEAEFPGMPSSAMRFAAPDFVARLKDLPGLVDQLVREAPFGAVVHEEVRSVAEEMAAAFDGAPPSAFTCPDCGGTLFERESEGILQFRCRVGHGYTGESLLAAQHPHLESALYGALVALEERADLSRRMARRMDWAGKAHLAERYWSQADATEHQASVIREAVAHIREGHDEADG